MKPLIVHDVVGKAVNFRSKIPEGCEVVSRLLREVTAVVDVPLTFCWLPEFPTVHPCWKQSH